MAHRAAQIIDAIVAELVESNRFGSRVYKERTLSLSEPEVELPAVCAFMGPDEALLDSANESLRDLDGLIGNQGLETIDSLLTVVLTLVAVAESETALSDALMRLRADSHIVIMADRTHGLTFVTGTAYQGALKPEKNAIGENITGSIDTQWAVQYRMQSSTPE